MSIMKQVSLAVMLFAGDVAIIMPAMTDSSIMREQMQKTNAEQLMPVEEDSSA